MAAPNIKAMQTLYLENDRAVLTTTMATVVSGTVSGEVQDIQSIFIPNGSASTISISVRINSTALLSSASLAGNTAQIIGGPITLEENECLTAAASAMSAASIVVNKRRMT